MHRDLETILFHRYPEILKTTEAATSFSMGCDDGWFLLIDRLCDFLMKGVTQTRDHIEFLEKALNEEGTRDLERHQDQLMRTRSKLDAELTRVPKIRQIKEKFGTLRFYTNSRDPLQWSVIHFAESMSSVICEVCGTPGRLREKMPWVRTLCDKHYDEHVRR